MPRPLSPEQIEAFRDDLCRVAERLFAERGFEGVTMRALANELGCSSMTPYRYFENKEAILAEVRRRAFLRHGVRSEKLAIEHSDPVERFCALARGYVRFARDEPHAYRTMFELSATTSMASVVRDPERRDELVRGWRPFVDTLTELVETGRAQGDPLTLAHLAWVTLHGLATLELSNKFLLGRDLDALLEPALDHFLRGIGAPLGGGGTGDDEDFPEASPST